MRHRILHRQGQSPAVRHEHHQGLSGGEPVHRRPRPALCLIGVAAGNLFRGTYRIRPGRGALYGISLRGKYDQCGEDRRCGGDQRRPPEPLLQERDRIYGDGVAHTVPDEKGSGIAFRPPEQGIRGGRKSRI